MGLTRDDLVEALTAYWGRKALQFENAAIAGVVGAGTAGSVRGGKQFDPMAAILAKPFLEAGYAPADVRVSGGLDLPGYFRPTKNWDLVISVQGVVAAAFEMKALGGPSFGNNANNRVEEALGSSTDIRQAMVDGLYGDEPPWLGYLMVIEDHTKSRSPVKVSRSGPITPAAEWTGLSYQGRFGLSLKRMQDLRVYDAVCLLVSDPSAPAPREPEPALDWRHFTAAINARISYLKDLGYPHGLTPLQ